MKEVIVSRILNASESVFFARELDHIKSKSYDVIYQEYRALALIPISTEAGTGAESITYHQFDNVGMAKILGSYADDLPRSDVKGQEFTARVRGIGGSYGYSIQEIRSAMMAGRPLAAMKANAARKSNDQLVNQIAWFGDASHNLQGLIYNANVTKVNAITGDWMNAARTAAQIVADVNDVITDMMTLTKGAESPNRILLPVGQYGKIASMQNSVASDVTVLDFLLNVWRKVIPGFDIEAVAELGALAIHPVSGAAGPVDVGIAYRMDPDKLTLEIPQPYEQFPAEARGLEFVVAVHSRCGGVLVYYPLSVTVFCQL